MKKKVLLIQPPHYFNNRKGSRTPTCFPLGLCYIATIVQNHQHQVEILDLWIKDYSDEQVDEHIKRMSTYDFIGISALSTQYSYVKSLTGVIKKYHPQTPIILGNSLATHSAGIVLKNCAIDICVRGEGEETILDILENEPDHWHEILGISFKNANGELIHNQDRKLIKDLDSIPFPNYELFQMDQYLKNIKIFGDPRFSAMNIITGRGCPYACSYCSKNFPGYRFRSIENISQEIEELKKRYGIHGISFSDELVLFSKDRAKQVANMMKFHGLLWDCQGRINTMDREILHVLKDSGCLAIGFGIESGSPQILNRMNKNASVSKSLKVVKETIRTGIRPILQVMWGYSGDDDSTAQETVKFFEDAHYFAEYHFSITTPLPGTPLYQECLRDGLIRDEEKYLISLDQGYFYREGPLVNLTNYGDLELIQKKEKIEEEINNNYQNYIKSHPIEYLKIHLSRQLVDFKALSTALGKKTALYDGIRSIPRTIKLILGILLRYIVKGRNEHPVE